MMGIEELAKELMEVKKVENQAKSDRIEIEEKIAALVDTGDNGSKTVGAGDGLKLTVKRGLGYKADVDAIAEHARSIHAEEAPLKLVPESLEFDEKMYEALRKSQPALYADYARYVLVTPKKVSVTLKIA